MADKIILNVPRYAGEYDFDINSEPLTNLEWRWVKKISGYLPGTIGEGWDGGDPDLFVAFAVVALARAGRISKDQALATADVLMDAPFDGVAITMRMDEEAATDDPPTTPAEAPATETQNGSTGPSSPVTSESLAPARNRIGVPV